jgi:heat shock protein HslJ
MGSSRMRLVRVTVLAIAALAAASTAQAQGLGRRRGNPEPGPAQGTAPPQKEEKRFPLGQAWIAVSINGKSIGGTERPTFTLDEQFRVRGFGGCNTYSTTAFPLREQGIAVGPLALTKRSCDAGVMATEKAFLMALRTSAKWDTPVASLVLRGPSGELKFERAL